MFCNAPVERCPEGAKKAASMCIGWIRVELLNWMATAWPGSKRGGNEGGTDYQTNCESSLLPHPCHLLG